MPKRTKSQWDFGELFPAQPARRIFSVLELTTAVKDLLEDQLGQVSVAGEISNARLQSSGHAYFSLKDAAAQLQCVLFRGEAISFRRELLSDGRKVTLSGILTVYEARGQYQLRVTEIELEGVGALQIAFEKLKLKLQSEGLFAPERKRPLPRHPRRLGLVTSPTGAAIRDVLHALERRFSWLEIVLVPCRVQGAGAAASMAEAIVLLNDWSAHGPAESRSLDLILLTRGGGSIEDLWAFNEEILARAIFRSAIPIVSAVGHEIDFTIADFVADIRAATPSAAAELITAGLFESRALLDNIAAIIHRRTQTALSDKAITLEEILRRFARAHPRGKLEEQSQRLDEQCESLTRLARQRHRSILVEAQTLSARLLRRHPGPVLKLRREKLARAASQLIERGKRRLDSLQNRLASAESRLRLLSPQSTLERGYSITTQVSTGKIVRDASHLKSGDALKTRLASGEIESAVR